MELWSSSMKRTMWWDSHGHYLTLNVYFKNHASLKIITEGLLKCQYWCLNDNKLFGSCIEVHYLALSWSHEKWAVWWIKSKLETEVQILHHLNTFSHFLVSDKSSLSCQFCFVFEVYLGLAHLHAKYAFWSGQVRVPTSTWLRCCGIRTNHITHPKNFA